MIKRVNPPSQREMANPCRVSLGTVNRIINCLLKAKLRKKRPVHKLSDAQIKKRRARAWRLYLRLNNNKWKNFVTKDEAMFTWMGVMADDVFVIFAAMKRTCKNLSL